MINLIVRDLSGPVFVVKMEPPRAYLCEDPHGHRSTIDVGKLDRSEPVTAVKMWLNAGGSTARVVEAAKAAMAEIDSEYDKAIDDAQVCRGDDLSHTCIICGKRL